MIINDENIKWALTKLARFKDWRNFPTTEEGLLARAESFLRLVHNKTVREIIEGALEEHGTPKPWPELEWKLPPDLNDADWILALVEENLEEFPLPVQMRRLYREKLPPAENWGAE